MDINILNNPHNNDPVYHAMPHENPMHEPRPPHPMHMHDPHHAPSRMPPHLRGTVAIDYSTGFARLEQLFGSSASAFINVVERCPLEVKVTLAIALGLDIDFGGLPQLEGEQVVRHSSPFISEQSLDLLANSLHGASAKDLMRVYQYAPDEQVALAIAVATALAKKTGGDDASDQEGDV